jgi:hypothetical protein
MGVKGWFFFNGMKDIVQGIAMRVSLIDFERKNDEQNV